MCPFMIGALVLLVLYVFFEVHYYIRLLLVVGYARYFGKRLSILETSTTYSICTSNDMDVFFNHMNNGRYLREMDFGRFVFQEQSRLYEMTTLMDKGELLLSAVNLRFRKLIPFLATFKIETQIVYWEGMNFYYEQRFITPKDGIIRAVAFVKQTIRGIGWESAQQLAESSVVVHTRGKEEGIERPTPSKDLLLWIQSLEENSKRLKPKKATE